MNILLSPHLSKIHRKSFSLTYLNYKILYKTSYLNKLYQYSKTNKTPFFLLDSHHIRIIQDPLDFYLSLIKGIQSSTFRIGLSCLYLGTGTLQRYLLKQLKKRQELFRDIDITMVFDYNRSLREQKGQSSVQMLYNWKQTLNNEDVTVAFNKNSGIQIDMGRQFIKLNKGNLGVLGEIMGVHHQKMAIFDDKVIIGGANMSQSYFLNRKDRYMQLNQCQQLSSYLFEYLKTLSQNSYHIVGLNKLQRNKNNLKQHYKLWSMAYRPNQYKQTISQQQEYLNHIKKQIQYEQSRNIDIQQVKRKQLTLINKNQQIAKSIGTSIKLRQQLDQIQYQAKINTVRQNLFGVAGQDFVGNQLQLIANSYQRNDQLMERGQKVYIFPFMHFPSLQINSQPKLFNQILQIANNNGNNIKISSGYLNLTQKILSILSQKSNQKVNNSVQLLCSAPQANSFYEGGRFKKYIPYFYRCFQIQIFKKFNKHNKFSIFEYNKNDEWTFHSKGAWIKQTQNSYLTVLGSSNYNWRSQKGDTQLQLYLYSTCKKFNNRLQNEWNNMKKDSHEVNIQKLQKDEQIKCSSWIKLMSKIFKRFL